MKIESKQEGKTLAVKIEGSIDPVTAPELEKFLCGHWDNITELIFDFSQVEYVSRAGLRVILVGDQHMNGTEGKMILRGVNDDVREVFEMTGFDELLNFE